MKKIFLITALALVMALAIAPAVTAKGKQGAGGKKWQSDMSMSELNLTDDQLAKIRDLRFEAYKDRNKLKLQIMNKHNELELMVMSESKDETKINNLIDELYDLKAKEMKARLKLAREIRNILTPEQQVLWDLSGGRMGKGWAKGFCTFDGHGMKDRGKMKMAPMGSGPGGDDR